MSRADNIAAYNQRRRDAIEYTIEEYEFMRSFGMDHERACSCIGVNPVSFRDQLRRFDRQHSTR